MNIDYIVQKTAMLATKAAMDGRPVEKIQWYQSTSCAEDQRGFFVVTIYGELSAADTPPWEKNV